MNEIKVVMKLSGTFTAGTLAALMDVARANGWKVEIQEYQETNPPPVLGVSIAEKIGVKDEVKGK